MKILVVDDNSDFRNSLVEYLKSKSYLAEGVSNGKLALQKLDNKKFDLVLLDLIMSGMDGFETMEKIEKSHGDTNVIVITGAHQIDKFGLYEKGCLLIEKKPIDLVELEYKIRNIYNNLLLKPRVKVPAETKIDLDINNIYNIIITNIDKSFLNTNYIADSLFVSKKLLYNRVGSVLSITVHEMIKNVRLLKAYEIAKNGQVHSIKQICYLIGYKDSGYFAKLFYEAFDVHLSEIVRKNRPL